MRMVMINSEFSLLYLTQMSFLFIGTNFLAVFHHTITLTVALWGVNHALHPS